MKIIISYSCYIKKFYFSKMSRHMSQFAKDVDAQQSNKIKPFHEIPGPFRLPVIGNLYQYKLGKYNVEKYFEVLGQLYDQYGPVVRQDLGNGTIIHVFDPEDIKTVYTNEGTMPYIAPLQEAALLYRKLRGLSLGLGNMNGEEWYRLRNSIRQLMLRKQEVSDYLPMVRDVANELVQRIKQKGDEKGIVRNLADEIGKWSLESAGVVCFDTRLGSLSGGKDEERAQEMVEANRVVFQLSAKLKFSLPIYKYITTPTWKKLLEAEDFFYRTAINYADKTIEKIDNLAQRNELKEGQYDFLTYLLGRRDLSRKDVIVLTFSLFADGLSTTVPVLLYNLYCLATNPEVQEKVYQELKIHLKDDEPITAKTIQSLSYLRAVIKETFRLYPNGTEVSRIIPKDLVLSGYLVPAGTHVNLNPLVNFKAEKYFKKPTKFIPERWVRGGDAKNIHPYLLTPFSHGVRTCAGMRFAEQDLHVVISSILRSFRLTYSSEEPLQQIYSTLIFPKGPLPIQFHTRNVFK